MHIPEVLPSLALEADSCAGVPGPRLRDRLAAELALRVAALPALRMAPPCTPGFCGHPSAEEAEVRDWTGSDASRLGSA